MDNKTYLLNTLDIIHKKNLPNLMKIRTILIGAFGEDNIQLVKKDLSHLEVSSQNLIDFKRTVEQQLRDGCYEITIRFPEILLTSEDGRQHTLRNLFVRFDFNQHLKIVGDYRGLRSSYTGAEWISDYAHSHLHGRALTFQRFCTGSGVINQSLAVLRDTFSEIEFQLFCLNIKSYVAWESISGTPYRYIRDIHSSVIPLPMNQWNNALAVHTFITNKFLQVTSAEELARLTTPTIVQGFFSIRPSEEFEKALGRFLVNLIASTPSELRGFSTERLIGYKQTNGNYILTGATTAAAPSGFRRILCLRFKGVDYFSEIIPGANLASNDVYPHPEITNHVIRKITSRLSKAAIELSTSEQESDS